MSIRSEIVKNGTGGGGGASQVSLAPDSGAAMGFLRLTTSAVADTVHTITLPDDARGVRITPAASNIRYAIGEPVTSLAGTSAEAIPASAFTAGNLARADQTEVRLLPAGTGRTLSIATTAASVVVDVEVF